MADLRGQLMQIRQRRGVLTAQVVVDEARPADHPLHDRFEWNDSIAGEAYRRVQAAEMIRKVQITYRTEAGETRKVRGFYAVATPRAHEYVPAVEVATDPTLRAIVLAEMERRFRELERTYHQFDEWTALIASSLGDRHAS